MQLLVSPWRRSQHPLARLASVILGLALLGLLLIFGLLASGVLLVGGSALLLWRYWKRTRGARPAPPTEPDRATVLEGEFTVLDNERQSTR